MLSIAKLASPPTLIIFFFCLFTLEKYFTEAAIATTCHKDDMAGLLGFKSGITDDPSGFLKSWIPGTDCCGWMGVECSNNRVVLLSVGGDPDSPLSGTISSSLSKLQHLTDLFISEFKNISGTFPSSILTLKKLDSISIVNNNLSGPIPPNISLLRQLRFLTLSGNQFSGKIPRSISKMTNLRYLQLDANLFTGTVPVGIKNLKNLENVRLERNSLTGPIPDFSSSSRLISLQLSHNKFSGKIPSTISPLAPTLLFLELAHNNLSGKIPDFLGKFRNLITLDLSWNSLSGTVPKAFSNLRHLRSLDLSHNLLVDPFPQLNLRIEKLGLSYNKFHLGQIPKWVTSSPHMVSYKFAKCGIKMKLENWKPENAEFCFDIDLSDNEISGSPIRLLNQTQFLQEFSVSGNKLKFNIKNLKFSNSLTKLDLSRNLVFGNLRRSISAIQDLNVSYNQLCGPIPPTNFSSSVFEGNDCLCGSPLSPCKAR